MLGCLCNKGSMQTNLISVPVHSSDKYPNGKMTLLIFWKDWKSLTLQMLLQNAEQGRGLTAAQKWVVSQRHKLLLEIWMQACGDVMIGQHGCMSNPYMKLSHIFVRQRQFPLLFIFYHHLEFNNQTNG